MFLRYNITEFKKMKEVICLLACDIINYRPELLNLPIRHDNTRKAKIIAIFQGICNTICYIGFGAGLTFLAVSSLLLLLGAESNQGSVMIFNTLSATILLGSCILFFVGRCLNKKKELEKELNNADIYYHNAIYNKDIHKIGIGYCGRKYCLLSISTHGDGCMIVESIKFKVHKSHDVQKPTVDIENRVVMLPRKKEVAYE